MNVHEDHLKNQAQGLSAADLMSLLQHDQVNQWKGELPLKVEDYLRLFPTLQEEIENVLVLIMGEIIQREARGHTIKEEEYLERFPRLSKQLKLQLEFHRALQKAPLSSDTQDVPDHSSGSSLHIGRVMAKMKMHHSRTLGEEAFTGTYQPAPPVEAEGTLIANRYKLRQQIGEGGMGTVWMADQTEPIKRKVAVKLIRVERNQSKTILARFEAERQAIALMEHPNIAKLLDAGTTGGGAPYFVMELVKGIPLNDFCDQHRLTISERLNLFMQICLAVQHAHQKGIIHRDLKPSNILVESHDGKPVPKIIDFGLAKATSSLQLTEQSLYTAFGSVMGTPAYMAPEQATFNAVDVDTRADVYALGVILYELLTGTTPITRESLKKAAIDEVLRLVREQEAPTPSSRLSSSESTPSVAACRQIEPQKLGRFVKGDLDWIVMKALEKDRDRRYETANGFAADVMRYLTGEAVTAAPPSAAYRLKKLVRRNKGKVLAAGLVLAALIAGIIGTSIGLYEAMRQESLALNAAEKERQAKELAEERRKEAEINLAYAKKGNELLGSVFNGLDPRVSYGTVAEFSEALKNNLTKAVTELEGSAIGDPLAVAKMQNILGISIFRLGDANRAIELLEKSIAIQKARLGPNHPDTLVAMTNLAQCYGAAGRLNESLKLLEDVLSRKKATLGYEHPETVYGMDNLAQAYESAGRLDKALPLFEQAVEQAKSTLGHDHEHTLNGIQNLAVAYRKAGKFDKALPLLSEAVRKKKTTMGPDHYDTLDAMNSLAVCLDEVGKHQEAKRLIEETLLLQKSRLGADHPRTINTISNLAMNYVYAQQFDKAFPLLEESLRLRQAQFGHDHPTVLESKSNLAAAYIAAGSFEKALPILEETFRLQKAKLGQDHPNTLITMGHLAKAYESAGRLDEALPLLERALNLQKVKLGINHPDTLSSMANLAGVYQSAGRIDKARILLEESLPLKKTNLGSDHRNTLGAMNNLAMIYRDSGELDKALPLAEQAFQLQKEKLGIDHPSTLVSMSNLGFTRLSAGKFADAEPLLRECLSLRMKQKPDAWSTFNTMSLLGGALLGQKKYTEAEPLLMDAYAGLKARKSAIPAGSSRLPEALDRLIQLYTATNKPDEVAKWKAVRANYSTAKDKVK